MRAMPIRKGHVEEFGPRPTRPGTVARLANTVVASNLLTLVSSKLLHHLDQAEITETTIRVLRAIPDTLRPTVVGLVRCIAEICRTIP